MNSKQVNEQNKEYVETMVASREFWELTLECKDKGATYDLSKQLNEKLYSVKDTDISYRHLNHWDNYGLISSGRSTRKGWRKFSVIDILWSMIIMELRKFDVPLATIKEIKNELLVNKFEKKITFSPLEFALRVVVNKMTEVYLVVFPDGRSMLVTQRMLDFFSGFGDARLGTHIRVNINDLVQNIFHNSDVLPKFYSKENLSDEEYDLLLTVRKSDYDSIKIISKNGKINRIEHTESVDAKKATFEAIKGALSKGKYQEIKIQQEGGKVVSIKKTTKKKAAE